MKTPSEQPKRRAREAFPDPSPPASEPHNLEKIAAAQESARKDREAKRAVPPNPPEAHHEQDANGAEEPKEKQPPPWLLPKKVSALNPYLPPQVMKGLLYQGCRFVAGGPPKAKKSWFLMQSCYCIGNGLPFLGIPTTKGKTLYLNVELLEGEAYARFNTIQKALGEGNVDEVEVIQLRDKQLGPSELEHLKPMMAPGTYALAVFDPVYKLMGGCDERVGKDVAPILAALATIGEASKASIGYAQHFAKGNQKVKFAIDRISGSNYFVRDADVILVMTELGEPDCFRVDVIQRSFPDINPFGIRWQYPIFVRDTAIDIANIKEPGEAKEKSDPISERMFAALYAANSEGGLTNTDWWHASQVKGLNGKPNPSEATFNRKRKEMIARKEVEQSVLSKKYLFSVEYAQKRADFYGKNETNSHDDES